MNFYKNKDTEAIFSEDEITKAFRVLGFHGTAYTNLYFEPVKVSVIDLLKWGERIPAIRHYKDIHGCSLLEAREMVEKIQRDIKRYSRK